MKEFRAEEPPVSAEGIVQPIEEAQVRQAREEAGAQPEGSAETLSRECERLRDRLLRSEADLENWRKTYQRELSRSLLDQRKCLLLAFLPMADNLTRALDAMKGSDTDRDPSAIRTGVEMVHRIFRETLEREGVRPIDAEGRPFDPRFHEAVGTRGAAGDKSGLVVEVVEPGYLFEGEVLRPARVLVGAGGLEGREGP